MYRTKATTVVLLAVCGCLTAIYSLSGDAASAQVSSKKQSVGAVSIDDSKLAAEIRRRTKRDVTFLNEKYTENGVFLDFDGGFENVALARNEDDGTVTSACVASIAEANSFFGRNLDTGQRVPRTPAPSMSKAKIAADHGMSEAEFDFYSNLIEQARQHRLASPNAATINIVNNDEPNDGFNDPNPAFASPEGGNTGATRGQQRLNVFAFAAGIWGAFLDTSVAINVGSKFDPRPCSSSGAVLGSAGANGGYRDFSGAELPGTWYHVGLANKQAGFDINGASSEINATFNVDIDSGCLHPSHRWYYGLDNATPSFRTNLLVVVLHEIGHGLGFATFADGNTGALALGFPDVWSRFMFDNTTGKFWNDPTMTNTERAASARSNGGLRWDGPSVKIASSYLTAGRDTATERVHLYAPTTYSPGSSVSHFSTLASPNLLMEPAINSGLPIDGDLTRQLLRDIGWYRDTTSDVNADTITNVTPNGGAAQIGAVRTVTWTNNGGFSGNVTIELSTDGGATFPTVIASNIVNSGTFAWTVPNMPTSTARVRVREADFAAPSGFSSANFTISSAPLAAGATVEGRVVDASGRGIRRATVTLTDSSGVVRTAITSPFGYFVISDVPVGETYVANVRHKRYSFEPRTVNLTDNFTGLDFAALN
ncbi:MAG: carboxypeptidase regulatory-like domain-containing protein [Pyrinomonadaceae bacterium]